MLPYSLKVPVLLGLVEEYPEVPEEGVGEQQEDEEAAKVAEKIGKIVKEIEKQKVEQKIENEEETTFGAPVYPIDSTLLSAMLTQTRLYEDVILGRISVSQAAAIVEKELAFVTAKLEQDLKKIKKKSGKRKRSPKTTRSGKKRKTTKNSQ